MQFIPTPQNFDDSDDSHVKRTDSAAMRILSRWIAMHDGFDPESGVTVDRSFVVMAPQP